MSTDLPPLTDRQRRWRPFCVLCAFIGVLELAFGSLYIVSGNPYGAIPVVVGAAATVGGFLGWPTRWRNRLHQMNRKRSHGG